MFRRPDRRREFAEKAEALRPCLLSYCRHMLWDTNDLEDVLQTTLVTALEKFHQFETGTDFRSWIFQICTYQIFNFNRRSAKEREQFAELERAELDVVVELQREYAYDELLRHPDKILEHVGDEMHSALMTLPSNERSVFLLKTVVELTCKEISHILKMPMGSVMGYLARARGKLRSLLCDYAKHYGFLSDKTYEEKSDDLRQG